MKNLAKILVIPFSFFLLAAGCKKEDDLPKATQTGANIMAAKVNGKI